MVATSAECKCIAYMRRCIHTVSITSSAFPLHVSSIQIGAFHYAHQTCPFIAFHLSFPPQKPLGPWKALLQVHPAERLPQGCIIRNTTR